MTDAGESRLDSASWPAPAAPGIADATLPFSDLKRMSRPRYFKFWLKKTENESTAAQMANSQPMAINTGSISISASRVS
jgi:hypothetical protein